MGIYPDIGFQSFTVGEPRPIAVSTLDSAGKSAYLSAEDLQKLRFSDYNENVVSFSGNQCIPLRAGRTEVTAWLEDCYTKFTVQVSENGESFTEVPLAMHCFRSIYRVSLSDGEQKQLRPYIENTNGTMTELYTGITYSDYDTNVITINEAGCVSPVAPGTTEVRLLYRGLQTAVTVEIIP